MEEKEREKRSGSSGRTHRSSGPSIQASNLAHEPTQGAVAMRNGFEVLEGLIHQEIQEGAANLVNSQRSTEGNGSRREKLRNSARTRVTYETNHSQRTRSVPNISRSSASKGSNKSLRANSKAQPTSETLDDTDLASQNLEVSSGPKAVDEVSDGHETLQLHLKEMRSRSTQSHQEIEMQSQSKGRVKWRRSSSAGDQENDEESTAATSDHNWRAENGDGKDYDDNDGVDHDDDDGEESVDQSELQQYEEERQRYMNGPRDSSLRSKYRISIWDWKRKSQEIRMKRRLHRMAKGQIRWKVLGLRRHQGTIIRDLYFWLLDKNIFILLLIVSLMYAGIGLFFAVIYAFLLDSEEAIIDPEDLEPDSFTEFEKAVWFSFSYLISNSNGSFQPGNRVSIAITAIEQFTGLLLTALLLGIVVSKAEIPKSMIVFSKVCILFQRDNVWTLMIRIANTRGNLIYDPEIRLSWARFTETIEGENYFKTYELNVQNPPSIQALFQVTHQITEDSPLFGFTKSSDFLNGRIIIAVRGTDDVHHQEIYSIRTFTAKDVVAGARFADMVSFNEKSGRLQADMSKISEYYYINDVQEVSHHHHHQELYSMVFLFGIEQDGDSLGPDLEDVESVDEPVDETTDEAHQPPEPEPESQDHEEEEGGGGGGEGDGGGE